MTTAQRIARLIAQLAPHEGYTDTALPGVTLMRANQPLERMPALYDACICIVAQGRKRGFHGGDTYVYDAQHFLAVAVPLPFETETFASLEEPLLSLQLRIDPAVTAEVALAVDEAQTVQTQKPATLVATRMEPAMADAVLRLLQVLNSPLEARLLGPGIFREIAYRVLTSDQGGGLRAAITHAGQFGRIAKALRRIHAQYERDLDVATLAGEAHMSVPAFHSHFRAVTHTSPLQYLKSIRLHHARVLMIRSGLTAAGASARVGYESPSQFSREFKRLFGRSPADETRRLQQVLALS